MVFIKLKWYKEIKMTINLVYRLKRFFQGESGVVERVELRDPLDKNKYCKD